METPTAAKAPAAIAGHSTADAELSTEASATRSPLAPVEVAILVPKQSQEDDNGDRNPQQPKQD